jgi:acetolactate synthase small subunit
VEENKMNNDLISRKAVDEIIGKEIDSTTSYDVHDTQINIKFAVKELPTAYDVEKVVEQLEELRDRFAVEDYHIRGIIEKAIEIVRKGGVE